MVQGQILTGIDLLSGAKYGRRATWVGASGDQTFLRIDESLVNAHTLTRANIFANQTCIGEFLSIFHSRVFYITSDAAKHS